jgi:glucosamine-6-phosphate deaminase
VEIHIYPTRTEMSWVAAEQAAALLINAIRQHGQARLILATGASQFEMLEHLTSLNIPWEKVTVFHLDEYIGLPPTHPASFRHYLQERFVRRAKGLAEFVEVRGDLPDPTAECRRLGALLQAGQVDVACIGIGENGHLAFNDPPADFDTQQAYIVVDLDQACRQQQVGEGWFVSLDSVPRQAISMSIRQILKSKQIVCTVPDARKAAAVRDAVEGAVTNRVPASILQQHPACHLYLDEPAAARLQRKG